MDLDIKGNYFAFSFGSYLEKQTKSALKLNKNLI